MLVAADTATKVWAPHMTGCHRSGVLEMARSISSAERVRSAVVVDGAFGNLCERIVHGSITDWLRLILHSPTFSLADVAIRAGILAVLGRRVVAY